MARRHTERDGLDYLDNCVVYNPACFFMDLEHGYFHTANSRLSLFADHPNWAIVFEKSGYANRTLEIELELNLIGSDLRNLEPGGRYNELAYNSQYFTLVAADALDEVRKDFEPVLPSAIRVKVRDRYVGLPCREEDFAKWIPTLLTRGYPEPATFADLARYPAFEYEDPCRATLDELRTCPH